MPNDIGLVILIVTSALLVWAPIPVAID